MNLKTPHIINEGIEQYQLGELKGSQIHYDFERILIYLDAKGKLLFGEKFKILKEDREILYKLCNYQIKDWQNCRKLNIDINKGILLSGPVGCGKTSLMKLIRCITPQYPSFELIPTRNVTFAFNHIGYKIIEQYGDNRFYCFDDLGIEPIGRFFGKDCNVMGEVLLSRYELYSKYRLKTHCTTNLNAQELEEYYGNRVRSRMRQLFNLVAFDKESFDKRS
jgi:energy-coupling factor transporter ATP-binding protein EcfA2